MRRVNYPNRTFGGRGGPTKKLHVLIAEVALGKPLPKGSQVHHVDENPQNSKSSNLVICQDQAYHALLHVRSRIVRAGGNPNTQALCTFCGIQPRAAFSVKSSAANGLAACCKRCMAVWRKSQRIKND